MTRRAALAALYSLVCVAFAHAQTSEVKKAFAAVPFEQWVTEGPKSELRWRPRITPPTLTLHERIAVRVEVQLDGNELVKRCCDGQAIGLVEIKDQEGRIYRNYGGKELKDATPGMTQYMIGMSWEVFLLPGDYKATIAFYYSGRNAHSLTVKDVHVGALKDDPLPGSWRNLPAVEFCDSQPAELDAFLLPNIEGRLNLPVKTSRQIQLEILENVTPYPSERRRPKLYTDRLSVFLPILKTFSQLDIENGAASISLLDFIRRKAIYEQDGRQVQVSWTDLKDAMAANSATAVDVRNLEQGEQFGQYFWSEIAGRLEDAGDDRAMRVLIVISGPMQLGSGKPIEIAPPTQGNFAVFYLRCDFLQTPALVRSPFFAGPVAPSEQEVERLEDGVGKALRQLKPQIFTVDSAQGVRAALATIVNDISRM